MPSSLPHSFHRRSSGWGPFSALVSLLLLLSACGGPAPSTPPPSPTPDATATAVVGELAMLRAQATAAAQVTPTPLPTPTILPTATTVPPTPSPTAFSLADAVDRIKAYTVLIITDLGSGSGISLGKGEVLTNHHVVDGARQVRVRFADGRQENATVERLDGERDLALLKTAFAGAPSASFRPSREIRAGESLIAVGYPRPDAIGSQAVTVTRGIFSALWQAPHGVWHVQTDAAVNPGNSGGPLADEQGRVVGVVTFGIRGTVGLNYAVAGDEVEAFRRGGGTAPTPPTACAEAQVSLVAHDLQPTRVAPGGTITLRYTIANQAQGNAPVVLGASVRPARGGAWIDDPANDTPVLVPAGQHAFTRAFRVPSGTPAGSYDVAWGLFCADRSKSHGLTVAPAVLVVEAPGGASTAPGALDAAPVAGPAEAVRRFYGLIDAGDLDSAWTLLSTRFRAGQDRTAWKNGFRTTRGAQVSGLRVNGQTATGATVTFSLASLDASPSGTVTKRFQGAWTLVHEGGAWRWTGPRSAR